MAQADYSIANQGFPATRADINSHLEAIATNNSGTSAPSTQYAGQFWIDTTSSTWTLYIHDGADDIQFATIDTSANTVNFTDSALDVVTDTTPQLGGDLDVNGNDIVSVSNGNISITPDGTGKVIIDGLSHPTADGTADQVLKTDGSGNLSFTDISAGGITEADQWRLTANITSGGTDQFITSNLERIHTSGQGTLGTGMTESSGVFTFPSTGIWLVRSVMAFQGIDGAEIAMTNNIYVTVNNSTYSKIALNHNGNNSGSAQNMSAMTETFIDVTNTSNVKVKFEYASINNGNNILGDTTQNRTCFIFIRLGDT